MKRNPKIQRRKSQIVTIAASAGLLLTVGLIGLLSSGASSDTQAAGTIEDTRAALQEWVDTRRYISQEKHDLILAKEMLNERMEIIRREIEALREKITDAEKSIAEADKKTADMIVENEKLKMASSSLNSTIVALENQTRRLIKRLPDPIRDRIKPLSQRLPDQSGETKMSVAERFQNVVGILNEVNKFNRDITVTSEVRTLEDGSSVEVTAVYIGIGQAYYTSANGTVAGIGTVSNDAWVWKPKNEAAEEIGKAIAILKNEQVASFVRVPAEIQ